MHTLSQIATLSLLTLSLAACSGGDGSSSSAGGGRGGAQTGFFSLSITDAPIDDAIEVWVQFDAIELKHSETEEPLTLPLNPSVQLNLLALQGQNTAEILSDETIPAGEYEWIRLKITAANDGTLDSYIKLDDNSVHELDIPSGSETGLKIIGGLTIIANTPIDKTIDFDLRKSIVMTGTGDYKLKPVLKLVDDSTASTINGTVELTALTDASCPDNDPATGNAVYLFDGLNTSPDDVDNNGVEPVASALVELNNATGIYEYSFGFLEAGKYAAAYTCEAVLDDPTTDDDINFNRTANINLLGNSSKTVPAFK